MLGSYRNGTIVFEDEMDTSAFIDFALNERLYGGKSKVQQVPAFLRFADPTGSLGLA